MFPKNSGGLVALIPLIAGLLTLNALGSNALKEDAAAIPQDVEEICLGKDDMRASTVPYPASGPLQLSKAEAGSMKGSLPMDMGSEQLGEVWIKNADDRPASVLFTGEDGRPRAKAFLRPREQVKMKLREGAYDARFEVGEDWRGESFGSCSSRGKVSGIVVAKADAVSKVELSATSRFVVGNRLDAGAAKSAEQEALSKVQSVAGVGQGSESAGSRPGRESRDLRVARPESPESAGLTRKN